MKWLDDLAEEQLDPEIEALLVEIETVWCGEENVRRLSDQLRAEAQARPMTWHPGWVELANEGVP